MTISTTVLAEYTALTTGAGLADLSGRTLLELTGADRATFLHSFTTNEIKKLPAGGGCEAFVTNPQGKILGHVLVFCREDSLLLSTTPGQAQSLISHFERYVITEDVNFRDLSSQWGTLLLAGAAAPRVLAEACGCEAPRELLAWTAATIAGRPVLVARVDYAGPQSYFVLAAAADLPAATEALTGDGATPCGHDALEMARLEAGIPLLGQDITDECLPQEIGRDQQAISFHKGCYLGQETVARIDALGHVNRQLVGLRFFGEAAPPVGTKLASQGKEVGHVTSAAWSPKLEAPLALALVRRSQTKAATQLTSPAGDAVVIPLPV